MARWRRESHADVPERVAKYKPKLHGQGDAGVDVWRHEATAWLAANPGKTLPCGNLLGVLRTAVRLKMAEWGPWDD